MVIAMAERYERQLVPCRQNRISCNGYSKGRCRILHNTEFGKKPCPFYKPKAMVAAQMSDWKEINNG